MLTLIVVLAALYAGACVVLFFKQRSFQYFPTNRRLAPTQMAGTYERAGTLLQLTVRPLPGPGAVLYFGGNARGRVQQRRLRCWPPSPTARS